MNLVLLFPLGLAALGAWALPLLLHLARREQRTPTDFAALRWLAIRAKPRSRLRFDEWLLLAVRLALIAALALLLARPATTGGDDGGVREVVAHHPGLAFADGTPVEMLLHLGDDVRHVWLAPGFPDVATPRPTAPVATASLLRELDAELAPGTALVVFVPAWFDGADGERIRLSREVLWEVAAVDAPAVDAAEDPTSARLAIRHDDAHVDSARWLRAVAVAWRTPATDAGTDTDASADADAGLGAGAQAASAAADSIDIAGPETALPDARDSALAWLVAGPLPAATRAWIDGGGRALLAHDADWPLDQPGAPVADADGTVVAEAAALGRGRVVRLRQPMRAAEWPVLLEPHFPHLVRTLLAPPVPAPTIADAHALAPEHGGPGFEPAPREFPALLAWSVLALFALERWLATGRRREPGT